MRHGMNAFIPSNVNRTAPNTEGSQQHVLLWLREHLLARGMEYVSMVPGVPTGSIDADRARSARTTAGHLQMTDRRVGCCRTGWTTHHACVGLSSVPRVYASPRLPSKSWWTERESNPRPTRCHRAALPLSYRPMKLVWVFPRRQPYPWTRVGGATSETELVDPAGIEPATSPVRGERSPAELRAHPIGGVRGSRTHRRPPCKGRPVTRTAPRNGSRRRIRTYLRRLTAGRPRLDGSTGMKD